VQLTVTAPSKSMTTSGGGGGFSGVDVGGLLLLLITAMARRRQRLGWVDIYSGTTAMDSCLRGSQQAFAAAARAARARFVPVRKAAARGGG